MSPMKQFVSSLVWKDFPIVNSSKKLPLFGSTRKLLVIAFLMLFFVSGCILEDETIPDVVNNRIEHTLNYRIARAKEYSEAIYDQTQASVNLSISLEDLGNGSNTVIWDTVFSMRSIREYAAPSDPLKLQKNIARTVGPNEVLRISSSIQYLDQNNTTWSEAKGEIVPRDVRVKQIDISL